MVRRVMRQLSHSGHANPTVEAVLERSTRRLSRARLHYGHGTDSARDDAAALLWHVSLLVPPDKTKGIAIKNAPPNDCAVAL